MDLLILAGGVVFAIGVVRYIWKLKVVISQLKRDTFFLEQKIKTFPQEMANMLVPIRHQLAAVAAGGVVPGDLIRDGRLYREISSEDAEQARVTEGTEPDSVVFLDVRTTQEYAQGHVSGATLLPIEELDLRFSGDVPMMAKKVIVYCSNGERSRLACDFLSRQGYFNLYNMHQGLQRWNGPRDGEPEVSLIQIQSKTKKSEPQGIHS